MNTYKIIYYTGHDEEVVEMFEGWKTDLLRHIRQLENAGNCVIEATCIWNYKEEVFIW